ncbi:MAG: HEPN domain-containing protein [Patescibacteria group bacterium]
MAYLLTLCAKIDKEFLKLKENCKILDPYYIETRYPLDIPITYSKEQVKQAVDLAGEIVEFVGKRIGKTKREK